MMLAVTGCTVLGVLIVANASGLFKGPMTQEQIAEAMQKQQEEAQHQAANRTEADKEATKEQMKQAARSGGGRARMMNADGGEAGTTLENPSIPAIYVQELTRIEHTPWASQTSTLWWDENSGESKIKKETLPETPN